MRSTVADYTLERPTDLDDCLTRLAAEPGRWRLLAGGTDLMVLLEMGMLPHREYLSIWHLDALRGVERIPDGWSIGALTTYRAVQRHAELAAAFPMLAEAAAVTGGVAIQNRGTLGGNIANASPAADSPPALLAYGARLELASARGTRTVDYAAFHTGYKQLDLAPDELIARIELPTPPATAVHHYRKVGTRRAQAISKVVIAALAVPEGDRLAEVRLAIGSVAPVTLRLRAVEATLRGQPLASLPREAAREALGAEIAPIDDIRSTAHYRRRVAENLLDQLLTEIAR